MSKIALPLHREIARALQRWRVGIMTRGIGALVLALVAGLGSILLLRSAWQDRPWVIPVIAAFTLVAVLVLLYRYLYRPLRRKITPEMVARSIETHHPELQDRLVTAVEKTGQHAAKADPWVTRLVQDAIVHVHGFDLKTETEVSGYRFWQGALWLGLVALAAMIFMRSSWENEVRTLAQQGFKTPDPIAELTVTPGSARLRRGAELSVKAILQNLVTDTATLFWSGAEDSSWQSVAMPLNEASGDFSYQLFDLQTPLKYYVRAGNEISEVFAVDLFDAPQIKRIDLTYTYPSTIEKPPRHEQNSGDIWAPLGSNVKIEVLATVPIKAAELLVGEAIGTPMQLTSDSTAVASLRVAKDTFYRIRLISADNLDNAPLPEYFVRALDDLPPAITLRKPARDLRATMLEEVPVEAEISDDFGLQFAELAVTINALPEKSFPLPKAESQQDDPDNSGLAYRGSTYDAMIYLEDLHVEPGDFLSYYVRAKDRSHADVVTSEIYFVEIRNFEDIFTLAASQQSGSGGMQASNLALSEKEIITATTRLLRERKTYTDEDYAKVLDDLHAAQQRVRENIERLAGIARMQQSFLGGEGTRVVQELDLAIQSMLEAEPLIASDSLRTALVAERTAYNHLLRADAQIRQRQISMAQGGGGSTAPTESQQELARLFRDELNKLQNKYETLQQNDPRQVEQKMDEALKKIQELALRQQRLNEQARQLAANAATPEEKKREIEKLQRQQDQLNRDTQQAMDRITDAMKRQQEARNESLESLRRASSDMSQASNKMRKEQLENAAANGEQALDRLRKVEDRLRKSQVNDVRDQLEDLQNAMDNLSAHQRALAEKSKDLQKTDTRGDEAAEKTAREQQTVREGLQHALEDLQALQRRNAGHNPEIQRNLQNVQRDLQRADVLEKMRQSESALQSGRLKDAENLQNRASDALAAGAETLRRTASSLDKSPEEKLEHTYEQTQNLRQDLEQEMRRQLSGQKSDAEQKTASGSAGAPPAGGTGQELTHEQMENWREQLWRTRNRLEEMQRNMPTDSIFTDSAQQLIHSLSGFVRSFQGGDQLRIQQIEERIIDPMRRLEAELGTRLQVLRSKEVMRTVQDEPIPAEYRSLVEEYYRSLSGNK